MTIGVKPGAAEGEVPFAQIKEITGVSDHATIVNTWNNCSAKGGTPESIVADVVASLLGPSVPTGSHTGTSDVTGRLLLSSLPASAPRIRSNSMETEPDLPFPKPVIDLTNETENNEDLQKAIAASLENQGGNGTPSMLGGQITREDQDISRVLEASLADTKSTDGKKNPVWFFDHANPYERRREDSWPVGLKNVGNTCWFNAVIQSLFHLETFRELVIKYEPSDALSKDSQVAVFMVELRRLFALMLASDRKYLNPSTAIQVLKHSFSCGPVGQSGHATSNDQQDVSEFQHKLLDWLEEAFQHRRAGQMSRVAGAASAAGAANEVADNGQPGTSAATSSAEPMEVDPAAEEKDDSNDMVKLFYGKVKTFGSNAGKPFTTHTHFGQWPLYVAGYSDIHESLEAGLEKGDIETNNSEEETNQEQWFTRLPPLLTFELSRFSYNTMQSQAEKLHNKFSFPQTLFLDRYLEANREEVGEKRSKLRRLKAELSTLEANLHKYTHYGGGEGRYPLPDVLGCALEFAMSTSNVPTPSASCPVHNPQQLSQLPSTGSIGRCECAAGSDAAEPKPKNISAEELAVLRSCLGRWKEEVKSTISQYEHTISDLRRDISQAYNEDHLRQHKYGLHAVMVHEGEAISGHYWSYVWNRQSGLWLKFNDVCVVESSWEEVVKESEGGAGTASAYCLIYVQSMDVGETTRPADIAGMANVARISAQDFPSKDDALVRLPVDLQVYVAEDNQRLLEEMQQWDMSRAVISAAQHENDVMPMPAADIQSTPDGGPRYTRLVTGIKSSVDEYAHEHAQSMLALVRKKYKDIVSQFGTAPTWKYKMEGLVNHCFERYLAVTKDALAKSRLEHRAHLVLYLLLIYGPDVDQHDIKALIADQIARLENTADIVGWTNIQHEAAQMAAKCWERSTEFQTNYMKWHQEYHQFRVVFSLFVEGLSFYNIERYEDALPYLQDAHMRNLDLVASHNGDEPGCDRDMQSLDKKTVATARNQCLHKLNEMAFAQFENEDDYTTPLKVMLVRVLPILDSLQADHMLQEDADFAGSLKDRWVHLLVDETIDEHRMDALKDYIGQLFEPAVNPAPTVDEVKVLVDLGTRYKHAMQKYQVS